MERSRRPEGLQKSKLIFKFKVLLYNISYIGLNAQGLNDIMFDEFNGNFHACLFWLLDNLSSYYNHLRLPQRKEPLGQVWSF